MFTTKDIIPDGAEEVGIVVTAKQRPGGIPQVGDVVRLVYVVTEGQPGSKSGFQAGDPVVNAARVTGVASGGGTDSRNITVLVSSQIAGPVAALAASGNLAMTRLPDSSVPAVDFETGQ